MEQAAGWYRDPLARAQWRYFDGTTWTSLVSTDGVASHDPIEPIPDPQRRFLRTRRGRVTSIAGGGALLIAVLVGATNRSPTNSPPARPAVSTLPIAARTTSIAPATTTAPATTIAPARTTPSTQPLATVPPATAASTIALTEPAAVPVEVSVAPVVSAPPLAQAAVDAASAQQPAGSCDANEYRNSAGDCVLRPVIADAPPAGATAKCNDGTYSFSQTRSGTCSGHGGVATRL